MNLFAGVIAAAASVVKAIKGKAKISEIGLVMLGSLPAVLEFLHEWNDADRFDRIRAAFDELDNRTGLEGPDIIHDMPAEAEERMFDGIKVAGLELSLWVAGFYGDKPDRNALALVNDQLAGNVENILITAIKRPLAVDPPAASAGDQALGSGSGVDRQESEAGADNPPATKLLDLAGQLRNLKADPAGALKLGKRVEILEEIVLELVEGR